ncbi:crossover junction endonuclease EME1 [Osmerus eperlanus]|uniref:crossover junction endonuclease EME1 n=1 Tax=Osmerus eperlanus TaxID=29151 RepID=UPI002E131148
MDSYSDSSTSDLDEELPVYEFLLQPDRSNQAPLTRIAKPDVVVLDSSDIEIPVSSSPVSDLGEDAVWENLSAGVGVPDVKMISSDEEEAPYVPLAQRLKQKQEAVSSSSLFINGQNGRSPRNPSPPEFSAQSAFSESEPPLPLYDPEEGSMPQLWPPPKPSSWAGSTSTSPAKKRPSKRTPAEIQTSREEALRRREAREKTEGETRKETRKQEQEREKEERRALAQAAKALRPEECIKHIVACVDPALLQLEGGATLLASLQALGCSCAIEKQPLPRCVSWTRKSPCAQPGPQAGVLEPLVVLQIPVEQFIPLVHSYSQEQRGVGANGCPSLTSWILDLMDRNPGRSLSLVVIDLETYFKSQKSQGQKKLREAVLGEELGPGAVKKRRRKKNDGGGEGLPDVSRVDIEEALVHLQLHTGIQVRFLHTWADFSQHVVMTTKAVAEAPFKRAREQTGFSFCVESESAGGRKGARGPGGLQQVWTRQIQQLNRVSPDMASAILAAYPSPLLLCQAYRKCRSEREGLSLLSDLLIRRGEGVTATTRRIGPELSRRLFLLMTSSDPQQILDSTV